MTNDEPGGPLSREYFDANLAEIESRQRLLAYRIAVMQVVAFAVIAYAMFWHFDY